MILEIRCNGLLVAEHPSLARLLLCESFTGRIRTSALDVRPGSALTLRVYHESGSTTFQEVIPPDDEGGS